LQILALAINFQGFTFETLFREQMALKEALLEEGHEIHFVGPGYDYGTNDVSVIVDRMTAEGRKPDLLLSYLSERLYWEPLPESVCQRYELSGEVARFPVHVDKVSGIPKVMWINDFWHMTPEQWDYTLLEHGFDYVLATYAPPYLNKVDFDNTYSPEVRSRVTFIPLPRSADPNLFYNYGQERDIDVCLLGARGPFYELREYFHNTLSQQSWINYFCKEHPGYNYNLTDALTNEAYARVLARSKIFVSCTGRYKVPFIKISEVLASGALLMCDRPNGAEQLGLVDGQTYAEVDKVNFMEKVHYYLHHPDELSDIARRGQALFLDRFTVKYHGQRTANALLALTKTTTCVTENDPAMRHRSGNDGISGRAKLSKRVVSAIEHILPSFVRKPVDTDAPHVAEFPPSPWQQETKYSCLDWKRVIEARHVLEICQIQSVEELALIEKFGLNAAWSERPVITAFPEVVSARPKVLSLLAQKSGMKTFCEVGTARGLQSIFWGRYLVKSRQDDGLVFTCDIDDHETPRYRTPIDGETIFSRRELWQQSSFASVVNFVCGDSRKLAAHLDVAMDGRKIEMAYIDAVHDEENVLSDFNHIRRHLATHPILIFDDCDPRFPGVESAVNQIADELDLAIRLITFWPSPYTVAVLGSQIPLQNLSFDQSSL
jgi:hypothetical protein